LYAAVRLIDQSDFGGRLLTSSGLADLRDQCILAELAQKHPQSRAPIRADYIADQTIDRITINEATLVQVLRKLDPHVAPAPAVGITQRSVR